jgi:hypothetical protein
MGDDSQHGRSDWVNLCGEDGRVKARFNRRTSELVIKERGAYHQWRLALLLLNPELPDNNLPVESSFAEATQ